MPGRTDPTPHIPPAAPNLARIAVAGIIGPVLFITLVLLQGVLQPDYSHIGMPIRALAAWPAGWIQNLNFFIAAALTAVFVVGVHHAIQPTRFAWPAFFFCSRAPPAWPWRVFSPGSG